MQNQWTSGIGGMVRPREIPQYDKHLMYQTADVTELLQEGENGIGVTLASGWWSDSQTYVLQNYNYYGDRGILFGEAGDYL